MKTTTSNEMVKSRGAVLDTSEAEFGLLETAPSRDSDQSQLLEYLERNGYLFVWDRFAPADVLEVRNDVCQAMSDEGLLDPNADLMDCVPHPEIGGNDTSQGSSTFDSIPARCPSMEELLYDNKVWNGWLARTPVRLRENLGGRWLTAEFRPGDALIFSCKLIHASLDNQSDRFRLSSDCRYQRSDQPVDDRFIDPGPLGHVGTARRGKVC